MADIVNLNDRLKFRRDEDAKYAERQELTSKMIPVMIQTVQKFNEMGASPQHIVQFLQLVIDEIKSETSPRA
jgi:hypothetical protein